jgi:hypothetical protein
MHLQKVISNSKKKFFVGILNITDENRRICKSVIRIRGSGSKNPYQNVTDEQHWLRGMSEISTIWQKTLIIRVPSGTPSQHSCTVSDVGLSFSQYIYFNSV